MVPRRPRRAAHGDERLLLLAVSVIELDPLRRAARTVLRYTDKPGNTPRAWNELAHALAILRDTNIGSKRLRRVIRTLARDDDTRDSEPTRQALRELAVIMHLPCPVAAERVEQLCLDLGDTPLRFPTGVKQ